MECGCYTRSDRFKVSIVFCPLHKAAPRLYEALKAMYKNWVVRPDDEVNVLIYKMAEQALAEAKGKQ